MHICKKTTILLCLGVCDPGTDVTDVCCVRTPCLPGEQPVLWLRLGWLVVWGGWHNEILSFSLLSWKCIFVLSLCSFSIWNKNRPKQNSCFHLWRRPGLLVGSALHRQWDILLNQALRLCHLSKDSFGNAPGWELCSLVFGSTFPDPALGWHAGVTDCQHLTLSLPAFLQALCTGTGLGRGFGRAWISSYAVVG